MIKFLRKILLIDFVLSMFRAKQNPHVRFASFLEVFAVLWLILAVLLLANSFDKDGSRTPEEWSMLISVIVVCAVFFWFYRFTAGILKKYNEEEAAKFGYLRYINPVVPVVYFTTVFLLALAIINIVMLFLMLAGLMIFFLGIIVTFGLLLLDKEYKLDNFISIPNAFFKAENYFLDHIIGPEFIILFLLLIYFVIPISASGMILWQHYKKK